MTSSSRERSSAGKVVEIFSGTDPGVLASVRERYQNTHEDPKAER